MKKENKENNQASPTAEYNNDDDDLLALSLGSSVRSAAPAPPKPDPYLPPMYGPVRDQASPLAPSFHPYIRPCLQNPNPSNPASPSFVPDFSAFFQVQNPNPSFLMSLKTIPPMSNPNPNPKNPENPNNYNPKNMENPNNPNKPQAVRKRRNPATRGLRAGKSQTVVAPYRWATDRRAGVHTLEHLAAIGVETVTGEVQCRRCEKRFEAGYDLRSGFSRLRDFIAEKKESLRDRSAPEWDNPAMLDCEFCHSKEAVKAVVAEKKREINWLFLLLGGFLCCCTLEQLKYFCKHTGNHRTGAKNRVLYLTYLGLCKQLDPSGPFDALSD